MTETQTQNEIRTLTAEEIDAVGGGMWYVAAGVALGAIGALVKFGQEAYLAQQTAWYAER